MRSRLPSVARLVATAGAVRAVTEAAAARYASAVNASARQAIGARPQAQARPNDASETSINSSNRDRCGHADQRAHPRPLRYLMLPYAGAFSQWESPSLPQRHLCPTRSPQDTRPTPTTTSSRRPNRGPTIPLCEDKRQSLSVPVAHRLWHRAHMLDADEMPNASQNREFCGRRTRDGRRRGRRQIRQGECG
jgi:hypothetical protein